MGDRPTFEAIYLAFAAQLAQRSTCGRLSVGCVITSTDFRYVYAVGYNGNAAGLKNGCDQDVPGACGCVISGTLVTAAGIQQAYRRWYEGPVVRIVTRRGDLTVTPNHPVLVAGRGWVPAQALHEGDYVLYVVGREDVSARAPYDYHAQAVQEIFEAMGVAGRLVRCAGAGHQFHGDGLVDQQVDVVLADRRLGMHRHPGVFDFCAQPVLTGSNPEPPLLGSAGALFQSSAAQREEGSGIFEPAFDDNSADAIGVGEGDCGFPCAVAVADVLDGNGDHCFTFVAAEVLGFLAQHTTTPQAVLDGGVGDAHGVCDVHDGFTTEVAVDQIIQIERDTWAGHVFNFQTAGGWYAAGVGGIILNNCLHAEDNAVINCTTPRTTDKIVFVTHLPCRM
jgi:deoxycytidylate deaminase